MSLAQFEGKALVFNNGVVDVQQNGVSVVDSEKIAHIIGGDGVSEGRVNEMIDIKIAGKQDTLTAGTNISIENNVISASGGSGGLDSEGVLKVIKDNFGMSPSNIIQYSGNGQFTNIPWWDQSWEPYLEDDEYTQGSLPFYLYRENRPPHRMPVVGVAVNTGWETNQVNNYSILFDRVYNNGYGWTAEYTISGTYDNHGETVSVNQPISFINKGNGTYMTFANGQDSGGLRITVDTKSELSGEFYTKVASITAEAPGGHTPIKVIDNSGFYEHNYVISLSNYFYVDFYNNRVDMSQDVLSYLNYLHGLQEITILSQLTFPLFAIYKCDYRRYWGHYELDSEGKPNPEGEWVNTDLGPAYNVLPVQIRIVPAGIPDYWRKVTDYPEPDYQPVESWPYETPANYFAFLLDKGAEGEGNGDFFTGHIVEDSQSGDLSFVVDYMNTSLK